MSLLIEIQNSDLLNDVETLRDEASTLQSSISAISKERDVSVHHLFLA